MNKNLVGLGVLASAIIGVVSFSGCASYEENKQLMNINKDWNRVIRASHIYPIYPLTQDIMPGDVFIVSSDIDDTKSWSQPGYLPLDHLVTRLYPEGYTNFYRHSWTGFTNSLPYEFLKDNSWSNAPIAGFPSYSFAVKQGGGASVALPIQGIPVALSLMGAKQASGYVTLADAHTYGIDEMSLREQVWNYIMNNEKTLHFLLAPNRTNFLQVVSRVYSVGQVTVSMINDSSFGVTASGGAPKDVTIPDLKTNDAAANFSNVVATVNAAVPVAGPATSAASTVLPGGTLKFNSVTSRSVSMSESFPRPVIVGYTGFSFAIAKVPVTRTNTNNVEETINEIWVGESMISNDELLKIKQDSGKHFTQKLKSVTAAVAPK